MLTAAVLTAGPAMADCPTPEAVRAGGVVHVTYPDDSRVALKHLGEGMVQETTRYSDGGDFRMISMGGVFITDEVDLNGDREVGDTRVSTRYPPEIDAHLPLAPDTMFEIAAVNQFADGSDAEDEYVQVRTGALADVDIAGCSYQGFPVLMAYRWYNESFTSMMTHLPELGISVEFARKDGGEAPVPFAPEDVGASAP